jgi:predicted RNase H-like HicB family nuclease
MPIWEWQSGKVRESIVGGGTAMKESARYVKIVEWSEEDQCFVGSCPGLFYGGCHGDDESQVFAELCEIVDDTIDLYKQEGRPLPPPTSGKDYANRMLNTV